MIEIRVATVEDSEAILAVYAPYVRESAVTFEYDVPTAREMAGRVADILSAYPYLVCVEDGRLTGYAYAHRYKERAAYQWDVEFSVYLSQESAGKGIGKVFYRALIDLCRMQNAQNAYAGVTLPNDRSRRLHEGMGFQDAGLHRKTGYKLGSWHDVLWLQLPLGDYGKPPKPLIPFPLLEIDRVNDVLRRAQESVSR